jgi:hypothetical protein
VNRRVERGLVDIDRTAVGVAQLDLVAGRERAGRLAGDPEVLVSALLSAGSANVSRIQSTTSPTRSMSPTSALGV